MKQTTLALARLLDRFAPAVRTSFYRDLRGFQYPVGDGRRLVTDDALLSSVAEFRGLEPQIELAALVVDLMDGVPLLPPPINTDYRLFQSSEPFPPHVICFALAYVRKFPEPRYVIPFTSLVVRTGWWAGDENCIDDILGALGNGAEVCREAADLLIAPPTPRSVFAAGQLLYHLRYGVDWGLRDYIKEQYTTSLRLLSDSGDLAEVRQRLESGLKPWKSLS